MNNLSVLNLICDLNEIEKSKSEEIKDRVEETVRLVRLTAETCRILNRYHMKEIDEDTALDLWDAEVEHFLEKIGRYE